jgi:demethoxyubiquinone hydroxylase (CLK1/Coq7/Cat5 family)
MAIADTKSNKNVDQLNSFLRGERAAVEAYKTALDHLDHDSASRTQLEACMASHLRRVHTLANRVTSLGGKPAQESGPWGAMTGTLEAVAAALGEKAAIAALESGEDHGLADYQRDVKELTADQQGLVTTDLLPAQQDTHARMSALKNRAAE